MRSVRWVVGLVVAVAATTLPRAQVLQQVTHLLLTQTTDASIDDAGTSAYAISDADPFGTNPGHMPQVFRWDLTSGTATQLTTFPGGVEADLPVFTFRGLTSTTDDGEWVVFVVDQRVALMRGDGTELVQLTSTPAPIDRVQIAGNGSRVAFDSSGDLTGQNPSHVSQVFLVEADGSNLRQLTSGTTQHAYWPTISDDGERIVWQKDANGQYQLEGMLQDGTGYHALTSLPFLNPSAPQIAGNGQSVTFLHASTTIGPPDGCAGPSQVGIVEWDGTGLTGIAGPCAGNAAPGWAGPPDISDDAQTMYFDAFEVSYGLDVWRRNRDLSGWQYLTDTLLEPSPYADCNRFVRAAGGGSRVVFTCEGGSPWGGPNPDLGRELYTMSTAGGVPVQLSRNASGNFTEPDLAAGGSMLVFTSTADPTSAGGIAIEQLYRASADGTSIVRLTSFPSGTVDDPYVDDAGSRVVFSHEGEVYVVGTDGTGLLRLSPPVGASLGVAQYPHIAANGSVIVFNSQRDLLSEGGTSGQRIYRVLPNGAGLARLSPKTGDAWFPRVDPTGTWVAYVVGSSLHRQRIDGTGDQVIGTTSASYARVDVSSGGDLVVYAWTGNPLATNPDGNQELFLWRPSDGTIQQLTFTPSGSNDSPVFSRDGLWVYFWSDAPRFGLEAPYELEPYRVEIATGIVEPLGGLLGCATPYYSEVPPRPVAVSASGTRLAFAASGNCTGKNRDGNFEIVLLDRTIPPRIAVSSGSGPTIVSWDPEPGLKTYDVIRGDVDALGAADLGPVVCLANDSLDTSGGSAPDSETPVLGQAFFYLYRGSPGPNAGPGSYGNSSSGTPRAPASGGCAD